MFIHLMEVFPMVPEVTVLVPFYNREQYLCYALESVCKQTYQNWKMILIDDGSTDQSVQSVAPFLNDSRITLIKSHKNEGQSKSLNKGLDLVDTPFVMTLDSDDWLHPDALNIFVNEARSLPDTFAVVHGNITAVFQDKKGTILKEVIKKGQPIKDRYHFVLEYPDTFICPRFYRTSTVKEIGGWPTNDPYEGRYIEDLPVMLHLIEKYQFHYMDKTLYYYRQHTEMSTTNIEIVADKMKWVIRQALKRWGDRYEPIFKTIDDGWIVVERLKDKNGEK